MNKVKKCLTIVILIIIIIPLKSSASEIHTTDDLRVLMGMQRLSDEGLMIEIKSLLSSCYRQKEWNELVLALGDIKDIKLEEFKEKEDSWYNAKDTLESNFINNKSIEIILNDYINYQTATSSRVEYTKQSTFQLSTVDERDINAKIEYADAILEAADDNTNIGTIGMQMKTFTQDKLSIDVPFGRSYSIDTGKEQLSEGITISINQGNNIVSQLNGTVISVTGNSVTIKSGKSIEIEYIDIEPSVKQKQKIKQFSIIGKTKTNKMTVRFRLNTVYIDPLLLFGSRSINWYEQWVNSHPGCMIDRKDYSNLSDNLPDTKEKSAMDTGSGGIIIDSQGNTTSLIIQGDNTYMDTPDNLIPEKSQPGIIKDKE